MVSSVQTREQETREPAHQRRGRHRQSSPAPPCWVPDAPDAAPTRTLTLEAGGGFVASTQPWEGGHRAGTMLAPEWPAPASLPGALSWSSLHGWLEGHPWEGRASVHGCWRVTRSGMRGSDWSGQPRRSQTFRGSDTWDSAPAGGLCPPSPSRGLAHANASPLLYTSPLPWQVPQSEEGVWGGGAGCVHSG